MAADQRARELAIAAARAASDKKASFGTALDVSERLALTDIFVIISAANERQVRAVVDAVDEAMHRAEAPRVRREGFEEAHWVVLDYSDIVVHVFHDEDREFYALERLWGDCPEIELPEDIIFGAGDNDTSDDDAAFSTYRPAWYREEEHTE